MVSGGHTKVSIKVLLDILYSREAIKLKRVRVCRKIIDFRGCLKSSKTVEKMENKSPLV